MFSGIYTANPGLFFNKLVLFLISCLYSLSICNHLIFLLLDNGVIKVSFIPPNINEDNSLLLGALSIIFELFLLGVEAGTVE